MVVREDRDVKMGEKKVNGNYTYAFPLTKK